MHDGMDRGKNQDVITLTHHQPRHLPIDKGRQSVQYSPMSAPALLFIVIVVACLVNVPLGYLREGTPRFSFAWYFYIHVSIPLLIYLRIKLGFSWNVVPLTIAGAVAGQLLGGRMRRGGCQR